MEKINITDIVPADYNPRIMYEQELQYLKNSIDEFGLVDPIIINLKNNRIIGGHQRYKILKEEEVTELNLLRLGDIGWVFLEDDLKIKSDNHEKSLNIALNKIKGKWDNPKLDELFDDFGDDFNMELIGFENIKNTSPLNDLVEDNEKDFFNNVFTDMDDIDDLEYDEIDVKETTIKLKMGDYTISLENVKFNYWIRQIEKDKDFNLFEVKEEIKRRLGFD